MVQEQIKFVHEVKDPNYEGLGLQPFTFLSEGNRKRDATTIIKFLNRYDSISIEQFFEMMRNWLTKGYI